MLFLVNPFRNRRAFTLIELLIVIAILLVLSASAGNFATRLLHHGHNVAARLADDEQARFAFQRLSVDIASATAIEPGAAPQELLIHRPDPHGKSMTVEYHFNETGEYFRIETRADGEKHKDRMLQNVTSLNWTAMPRGYEIFFTSSVEDDVHSLEKQHRAFFAFLTEVEKESRDAE